MLRSHEPIPPCVVLFDGTANGEWGRYLDARPTPPPRAAPEPPTHRLVRAPAEIVLDVLGKLPKPATKTHLSRLLVTNRDNLKKELDRLAAEGKVQVLKSYSGQRLTYQVTR